MSYNSSRENKEKGKEDINFAFNSRINRSTRYKKLENKILVLDYLAEGKGFSKNKIREAIIQGIGTKWFSLLEVSLKKRGNYEQFSEINLPTPNSSGSTETPVNKIIRQLSIDDLTNTASEALEEAIIKIISRNEKRFVAFFNKAQPITNRIHSLSLIPGIGKKLMWDILEERKRIPFVSFSDIEERVKITGITKMIQKRILQELEGNEKHLLFTSRARERDSAERNRKRR